VLELIEPVDPDNLQRFGDLWVAKWAPPVLEMEIEILKRTPQVAFVREYEPENLPGWAAIEFKISND
jgi:hypothetical protein